jgi:hypothetical protein
MLDAIFSGIRPRFLHLIPKRDHAALVGFDLRQMEGNISVEFFEESYPIANQDREDRITHLVS